MSEMEKYNLRQRVVRHEDSNDEDSEDSDYTVTSYHAPVRGQGWFERREFQRIMGPSRTDTNIFGKELLEDWQFTQRTGSQFETLSRVKKPEELEATMLRKNKRIKNNIIELNKCIAGIAKKNKGSTAVLDFFYQYLKQVDDVNKFFADLGFDHTKVRDSYTPFELLDAIDFFNLREDIFINPSKEEEREIAVLVAALSLRDEYASGKMRFSEPEHVETFIKMIEVHFTLFLEKEREILEKIAFFHERIKHELNSRVANGMLPISKEVVAERVDKLEFSVLDSLVAIPQERWGDYTADTHSIRLAVNIPGDFLWPVYVHEVLHAISGQTERVEEESNGVVFNNNLRMGMMFNSPEYRVDYNKKYTPNKKRPEFRWLNEAITEKLTIEIAHTEKNSYPHERALLDLLVTNGIPFDTLVGAYFENYRGSVDEHATPAIKKLFQTSNAVFGKRFMVDLDTCIRFSFGTEKSKKLGVRMAVEFWKSQGSDFPGFVADTANEIRKKQDQKTSAID